MGKRSEEAVSRFMAGFSCAQAVGSVFAADLGIPEETLVRAASGFGGGMGHTGGACGVLTGAVLVIGLRPKNSRAEDRQAREATYALVREFLDRFTARHGAVSCTDLLGCDLATEEGRQTAQKQNLTRTICPRYIRGAVEILESLIGPDLTAP
jgi:C_GCAxxG_C_C family probable redox protein